MPYAAYTAADGASFVRAIGMTTGVINPIVNGLGNPVGLVFVDASKHDANASEDFP